MKSSDKAFKILLDNGARIDMKASHQFTVVDLALGNWVKVNKEYSLAIIEKVRSAGQIDNTAIWTARLDAMANIIKLLKNKKYKPHESTIEQMGKEASSFNDIIKIQGFSYIPPIFIPWE